MQSTARSISRLQGLLDGELVEGLRLGDPGLTRERIELTLSTLKQQQQARLKRSAARRLLREQESVDYKNLYPGIKNFLPN